MIKGYGLHTGVVSEVRFYLEEGPVRFRRGKTEIEAHVSNVINTERCTVLGKSGETLAVVEHLLAALYVRGWWKNLVIEVSDRELPILDGSAQGWLEPLSALGPAPEAPEPYQLRQALDVSLGQSKFSAHPGQAALKVSIDFNHPMIGKQSWSGDPNSFHELLSARTFGFLHELEYLRSKGLASQASLENAIVFDEKGALQALRYPNEPVRHKAVDALGDLYLLGKPLNASLAIVRGSHHLHVAFVQQLFEQFGRPDETA